MYCIMYFLFLKVLYQFMFKHYYESMYLPIASYCTSNCITYEKNISIANLTYYAWIVFHSSILACCQMAHCCILRLITSGFTLGSASLTHLLPCHFWSPCQAIFGRKPCSMVSRMFIHQIVPPI